MNLTTDAGNDNGLPSGMTANAVEFFTSRGITVVFSVGGYTYTSYWDQALATDPVSLGRNAANAALQYGVAIEIDYENDNANITGLQIFVQTFRSIVPFNASRPTLTMDVGAGTTYLGSLATLANTFISNNQIDWMTAEVGSVPYVSLADGSQYWIEHLQAGTPGNRLVISHYSCDGSSLCTNFTGTLNDTLGWLDSNDVRGVSFWAAGMGYSVNNCTAIQQAAQLYLNWNPPTPTTTGGSTTGSPSGTTSSSSTSKPSSTSTSTSTTGSQAGDASKAIVSFLCIALVCLLLL